MQNTVRVGLVGSQFISTIHADALSRCAGAELFAVASPTPGHAEAFAARWEIPRYRTDYRAMLEMPEIEMVVVGAPNDLHCEIAVAAFDAGKHVVMEKPLALNLSEADRMIAAGHQAGKT
jgi:myo-inositol 2-dehydrogenase / D-chiro-inositol 1-dehydrogenase